ncbi:tetratricopeptide repeat protein [Chloroflexota bacterium]
MRDKESMYHSETELRALQSEAYNYLVDGNIERAIEIHIGIASRYQDHPNACTDSLAFVGEQYLHCRDFYLAENYFMRALGYNPLNPHYHYLLGFLYSFDNNWERAIREFEFAAKQNPAKPSYQWVLGWAFWNVGDRSKALNFLYQALRMPPGDEMDITDLSNDLFCLTDLISVWDYATHSLQIAPNNALAQDLLGELKDLEDLSEHIIREST